MRSTTMFAVLLAACGGSPSQQPAPDLVSPASDDLTVTSTGPDVDLAEAQDAGVDSATPPQNCQDWNGKVTAILKNASPTFATMPKTVADASKAVILFSRAVSAGAGNKVQQTIYGQNEAPQFWKMEVQSDCSTQFVSMQSPNLCLDAGEGTGTTESPTLLTQQKCDATKTTQVWKLSANVDHVTPLPNFTLKTADDRCIAVQGGSTNANTSYVMSACNGEFAQQYYLPGTVENATSANFSTYFKPNLNLYTAPFFKSTTTPNINPYKDSAGHTVPWQLLLPPGYDQSDTSKHYPVVVYLHGSGEGGSSNDHSVIVNGAEIFSTPEMQEKFPAIVIVPQCGEGGFCWGVGLSTTSNTAIATHELVQYIVKTYNGDPKRVYVSGLSIGGIGTWDFIGRWSDLFVAALPLSGASKADEPHTGWLATNVQTPQMYLHIPIWATHGADDTTVGFHDDVGTVPEIDSLAGGEAMLSLLACETDAPASPCGHGAWTQIIQNPGTLDWLFSQSR